jgi:hypothetical protein
MPNDAARPLITPDTKVGELLKLYPELEDLLVGMSPSFRALKNPVLRRTVAKIATLRQVAKVGNLALGTVIGRLREAAGQAPATPEAEGAEDEGGGARPAWATAARVTRSWDARAVIEDGGHPLERVTKEVRDLRGEEVYELVTPFVPAPLIDVMRQQGLVAYAFLEAPELCRTYFRRARQRPAA